MARTFGGEIGKQWREGQDTRSQLGTGDTLVWVENYLYDSVIELVNIYSEKTYAGSTFIVNVSSNVGSKHNYIDMDSLDSGSFYGGCGSSTGSLMLVTGSTSGSWISPILYYNNSEERNDVGSITDGKLNTWRYLTYDYGGSVLIDFLDASNNNVVGSFDATGSDNLENLNYLYTGSNIRLEIELGATNSWIGSIQLRFKPSEIGSCVTIGSRLSESRIYVEITENFTDTTYKDAGSTTGSWDAGSLILYPSTQAQSLSYNTNWKLSNFDRIKLNASGSNLLGSVSFYISSDDDDYFENGKRDIEKQLDYIGSQVKWKVVHLQSSGTGSSIIHDIDLTYKSNDY